MILDTSAVLAILLNEPEAGLFAAAIETAGAVRLSAASYIEAAIYVDRNGDEVRRAMLDTFLREFSIRIEPVTAEQALLARQAFVLFGKGRHKAGLNFGDCFSYALARAYREPLLFKGGDFGYTDLESAT
jgi:ribonuclease VapC